MRLDEAELLIQKVRTASWHCLTDWEESFLTSISERVKAKDELTPKQSAKLQDIYRKVCV